MYVCTGISDADGGGGGVEGMYVSYVWICILFTVVT